MHLRCIAKWTSLHQLTTLSDPEIVAAGRPQALERRTTTNHAFGPPSENDKSFRSGRPATRSGSTDFMTQPSVKAACCSFFVTRLLVAEAEQEQPTVRLQDRAVMKEGVDFPPLVDAQLTV